MAKQSGSYMGGFSGRLGPAVGYQWNGKWCLRARPQAVRNPRSEKQTEHREMFKREVQLAAQMRWAVVKALTPMAREAGMTSYNLFVSLNQAAFSLVDGVFTVDYSRLVLSTGTAAPVAMESAECKEDGIVEVKFDKNPLHLVAGAHDSVYLYAYCPAAERGYLAAPVYRNAKRMAAVLPESFEGQRVELYLMVEDGRGRWSETAYGGSLTLVPQRGDTASSSASTSTPQPQEHQETDMPMLKESTKPSAETAAASAPPTESLRSEAPKPPEGSGVQLGLFGF
ncbi:MAG: hypothetical protein IJ745_00030 [Bacteroidales bacterium]|nr:hypothetical protein [Bacteroidales bacterium]